MSQLARRLFYTNKITIKVPYGDPIEVEGVFLNWFGRSAPFLVLGGWAALMLASALMRA